MRRISILVLILSTCFVSAAWPQAQAHRKRRITIFDAPDAGKGAGQGTWGISINPSETFAGWYIDGGNVWRGYLRTRRGAIREFDPPDAGKGAGQGTSIAASAPAGLMPDLRPHLDSLHECPNNLSPAETGTQTKDVHRLSQAVHAIEKYQAKDRRPI